MHSRSSIHFSPLPPNSRRSRHAEENCHSGAKSATATFRDRLEDLSVRAVSSSRVLPCNIENHRFPAAAWLFPIRENAHASRSADGAALDDFACTGRIVRSSKISRPPRMIARDLVRHYHKSHPFHRAVPIRYFATDEVFVTRQGACGLVMSLRGIDHECLTIEHLESISHALVCAFRIFDENFRLYQYLIKTGLHFCTTGSRRSICTWWCSTSRGGASGRVAEQTIRVAPKISTIFWQRRDRSSKVLAISLRPEF